MAAALGGAKIWQTFRQVMLPMTSRGLRLSG
jgi:ABC-type spermidine/putrescine transport system permease subunit I